MTIFLTFNDAPSGIFSSQVIDVVAYLRKAAGHKIRLVTFLSFRGFFAQRRKIKAQMPDAIVVPMYPRLVNWRKNTLLLKLLCSWLGVRQIMARSVLATNLALAVKGKKIKVIYDGRGAIAAEWKEYHVVNDSALLAEIAALENTAINRSDAQLAVSHQLLSYWKTEYGFSGSKSVVIPCTINEVFENLQFDESSIARARERLGYTEQDLVFIFSGSVSGWQSFDLVDAFATPLLNSGPHIQFFFLSAADKNIQSLQDRYPGQVKRKQCQPSEVPEFLMAGDYGILIREASVTNQVASPVKFAEYLACGLPVIISENIGDYSSFIKTEQSGILVSEFKNLEKMKWTRKRQLRSLGLKHFTKLSFLADYKTLLN